jgi:hypothetical protein
MSAQLGLGLFIATIVLFVVGSAARIVVLIRKRRELLGTDEAIGPRWPMLALHVTPFALVAGYLGYANAVGHFNDAAPLVAVACTMVIIQLVVMGVLGLRATVVSFWATSIFVFVEVALATAMFIVALKS